MRCLGLDLGTLRTGVAVVEGNAPCVRLIQEVTLTSPKGRLPFRLSYLSQEIELLLDSQRPDVIAIETPFLDRDVRSLAALSQVRGAILVLIHRRNIPIIDLAPQSIKKTVAGSGKASKEQVSRMLMDQFGIERFSSQDASDATAVAYAGLLTYIHQEKLRELT